jgi:pyoverdine/dityrosine biosynthesis protein Dit1
MRSAVGVDDDVVSQYDRDVVTTYQSMCNTTADEEAIKFRGLTEMLPFNGDKQHDFDQLWLEGFEIEHPIQSKHSAEAELARRVMMAGFQSSRDHFRKLVADQHRSTLSLYRGQARFMQSDLASPDFLAKTPKQKKKTSFLVATEMILRNQAYSNMLELLLPNYVRLSIHAHTNKGPKFGICLLPRDQVRAIDSVVDRHALCPSYEFQVPTPWHNSIIQIEGDNRIYLGKAEIVHKATAEGDFEGGWVEDNVQGGHFAIRPILAVCASPVTTQASSMISVEYTDEKQSVMAESEIVEILDVGAAPNGKKLGLALTVRGKLSRFLANLVSRDGMNKKSIGHGAAITSS